LALALAGMDDQQTLFGLIGSHQLVARHLLFAHLFGMVGVALRLGHGVRLFGLAIGHLSSSSRAWAELERGAQKPRSRASENLSISSWYPNRFAVIRKSRVASSSTKAAKAMSKWCDLTAPVVAAN